MAWRDRRGEMLFIDARNWAEWSIGPTGSSPRRTSPEWPAPTTHGGASPGPALTRTSQVSLQRELAQIAERASSSPPGGMWGRGPRGRR